MKTKKPFQNSLNYTVKKGETSRGKSRTVPEMTMSLKELLARYTRGQSVATLTPVYLGEDEEFAQFDNLDRLEKMQIAKDNAEYIKEVQKSKQHIVRGEETSEKSAPKTQQSTEQSVAKDGSPPEQKQDSDKKST